MRRRFLDLFKQCAGGKGSRQAASDMDMVVHSPDAIGLAAQSATGPGEVGMEPRLHRLRNPGFPVLGAEHQVQQNLGE